MQTRNTTSLLVLWGNKILLLPSKAGNSTSGQVDPPSCSLSFNSEQERIQHVMNKLLSEAAAKNFSNFFEKLRNPIKFSHKDELGEKLFTGYVAVIKKDSIPNENFMVDESEIWEEITDIHQGTSTLIITPMFKRAISELICGYIGA